LTDSNLERMAALLERSYAKILEQKAQIARLSAGGGDAAVAIIGYGCRFPGRADCPDSFWRVLESGRDVFGELDDSRWPVADFHDPLGRAQGKTYTLAAGLVEDVGAFDAKFFGIPAVEAAALDPQQRMLLEVSWHALEHAGLNAAELRGSSTGVFVGLTTDDYARLHARSPLPVSTYTGLGSAKSMAAGRLAYFYDFQGPVLQLDTTCSSSLVAMHLAARELREGACDLALVGGANAILSPDTTIGFCEMKALSRRGQLRAFDEDADGYVRGEGCGVVVLKRYTDAVRDGNRIRGVLLGSAMNHDGRTNGLTAPNPAAQSKVIRAALSAAGCSVDDIDYVEAHGTGTKLGDLIEVNALSAAYQGRRTALPVGTVKANIGHLEAAAGMASVIKVLLALERETIPGQANFATPSSRIDWQAARMQVSARPVAWPAGERQRRAGISAFGMSGTNVHAIIGAAPAPRADRAEPLPVILVSARSEAAMSARLEQFAQLCEAADADALQGLAAATQASDHFPEFRAAVTIEQPGRVASALRAQQAALGSGSAGVAGKTVLVFPGQGAQWPGMAAAAHRELPSFRSAFDRCAQVFARDNGGDLLALCCDPLLEPQLQHPANLQPALVAMGIAYHAWWTAHGLTAEGAIGHSVGEYAAAVAVGSLSLEEAMTLACARGRSVAAQAPDGNMLAVVGAAAALERLVADLPEGVFLAAVNGPRQVTLACGRGRAEQVRKQARRYGLRSIMLAATHAFHSPSMQAAADDFRRRTAAVRMREPAMSWWSSSGLAPGEAPWREPDYWSAQLVQPVGFTAAVERALSQGGRRFLEIGPDAVLGACLREVAGAERIAVATTARRSWRGAVGGRALAEWFAAGGNLKWHDSAQAKLAVPHPPYPFERTRHWLRLPKATAAAAAVPLGFALPRLDAGRSQQATLALGTARQPHLAQHRLFGRQIVAAASWIALCLQVGEALFGRSPLCLRALRFVRPLVLEDDEERSVVLDLRALPDGSCRLSASSEGHRLFDATLEPASAAAPRALGASPSEGATRRDFSAFYDGFARRGYHLGEAFRWMASGQDGEGEWRRTMERPSLPGDGDAYPLFPGLIDSSFHALSEALAGEVALADGAELVVPSEIDCIRFQPPRAPGTTFEVTASRPPGGVDGRGWSGNLVVADADGHAVLEVDAIVFRRIARSALAAAGTTPAAVRTAIWRPEFVARLAAPIDFDAVFTLGAAASRPQRAHSRLLALDEIVVPPDGGPPDAATLRRILATLPEHATVLLDVAADPAQDEVEGLARLGSRWARLLAALGDAGSPEGVTYVAAVGGAVGQGGTPAALAGLLRCACSEYPSLRLQVLVADASHASGGPRDDHGHPLQGEFRLVESSWLESRPHEAPAIDAALPGLQGGIVLVTGGSAALAPAVLAWLRSFAPDEIWLASRHCVAARVATPDGPLVHVRCDVSDEESVRMLFAQLGREGKHVVAIVHLAGALADRSLANAEIDDFRTTLRPKLGGAINLARYWSAERLRWVLAVSSLASLSGPAGQGSYALANRALDEWAADCRLGGVRAAVLHLGPVDVGMASRLNPAHQQRLHRLGLSLLGAEQLEQRLSHALLQPEGQLAVYAESVAPAGDHVPSVRRDDGQDAAAAPVLEQLCDVISTLTGNDRALQDPDATLAQLGADSLLAAELSAWIQDRFSIDFSMDAVLAQPSVRDLAHRIDAARKDQGPVTAPAAVQWSEGEL
jgi:acyl transferase domain-containing protein/acyl carrier protein